MTNGHQKAASAPLRMAEPRRVLVVGDDPAAAEVLAILEAAGMDPRDIEPIASHAWVGWTPPTDPPACVVAATGAPERTRLADRAEALGLDLCPAVHPDTTVGAGVSLGRGVVVASGVRLTTDIEVGDHVLLGADCTVAHDDVLGRCAVLGVGVHLAGDVRVGAGAEVGAGAVAVPGVRIGDGAVVAPGAVVTHDVAPGTRVAGVPARPVETPEADASAQERAR